jgi:hypothetical protein
MMSSPENHVLSIKLSGNIIILETGSIVLFWWVVGGGCP